MTNQFAMAVSSEESHSKQENPLVKAKARPPPLPVKSPKAASLVEPPPKAAAVNSHAGPNEGALQHPPTAKQADNRTDTPPAEVPAKKASVVRVSFKPPPAKHKATQSQHPPRTITDMNSSPPKPALTHIFLVHF